MDKPFFVQPSTLLVLSLLWISLVDGVGWAQAQAPLERTSLDICLDEVRAWTAKFDACQTAAQHGNAEAQHNLGFIYTMGHGVDKDFIQGSRWYRVAAEQGLGKAQYHLGAMHANGRGVPRNHEKAMHWYRLAARQGLREAQFNLGVGYSFGQGCPRTSLRHSAGTVRRRNKEVGAHSTISPPCMTMLKGLLKTTTGHCTGTASQQSAAMRWRKPS